MSVPITPPEKTAMHPPAEVRSLADLAAQRVLSKRQELFAESMEGRRDLRTSSNHFFNQIWTRRVFSRPSSGALGSSGSSGQKAPVLAGPTPRQTDWPLAEWWQLVD